jgi:hypothetical protein
MRFDTKYLLAGCVLSAATFALAGDGAAEARRTECPNGPAHAVELISTEAPEAADEQARQRILGVVADATNRIFSDRGLDSILELVAKGDRDRIGKDLDKKEEKQFVAAADQVARQWREKYGDNFDAAANVEAFKNLGVTLSKDEQGRDRANVEFPSMNGEGTDDWRIALPNEINGSNFAGRMGKSLAQVSQQTGKDNWPDDQKAAYVNVSAQALHALAFETQPRRADAGRE